MICFISPCYSLLKYVLHFLINNIEKNTATDFVAPFFPKIKFFSESNCFFLSSASHPSPDLTLTFDQLCFNSKGTKVTTPPPFRKNSTGNPINQVNLNNPQLAALAAVLAKTNTQNKNPASESTSNMQRSSSHESHLRNKIQIVHQNDAASSAPQAENKADDNCFLATGDRRLSNSDKCGSELSSRCPSGQASPSLQSPGRFSKASNSMTNSIEAKSSQVNREHRFIKYVRIRNIKKCLVCRKPVWHGLKCKYCKFRCHKDCEKKVAQFCSVNSMSYFTNDLPVISVADNTEQPKFVQYSNTSSAASSTTASPALHNLNQSQLSESSTFNYSPSNSLTSAVFGFANKMVNSKNSTPITNHKPVKCVKDPHFMEIKKKLNSNSIQSYLGSVRKGRFERFILEK
ncbi:Kinase suppressor of Ras 2 [Brachionus plicatilis]|uniref:Kinase suppressor of Ras 2 n=1 Tax=Brachionus plicatilis TaxID=10195 RepID=A0A3M7QLR8_BRAPC|nr:Kinase suppressor of Ras 2 [Brachionus plicatilis]